MTALQQSLFVEPPARAAAKPPPSRHRDPDTSRAAAAGLERSGARSGHEELIIEALRTVKACSGDGRATYVEIAEVTGGLLDPVQVMRRLSGSGSLSDRGLVLRDGEIECTVRRRRMTAWRLA